MTLTPRQARFVEEYLLDLNATQAAVRAGYSTRTAKQQGQRLLTNVDVQAAVSAAQSSRSERTKIDADWVLRRLADEADADLADLYAPDGSLKPVKDWPPVWRKGLVAGLDVEEIKDRGTGQFQGAYGQDAGYEIGVGRITKIKLSDRVKRLELIGKHVDVQAFRERLEHSGPDGSPIEGRVEFTLKIVDPKAP